MNASAQEMLSFIESSRHLTNRQKDRLLRKVIDKMAQVMCM
ncbi:hypothetical protein [Photobacterium damselae]